VCVPILFGHFQLYICVLQAQNVFGSVNISFHKALRYHLQELYVIHKRLTLQHFLVLCASKNAIFDCGFRVVFTDLS